MAIAFITIIKSLFAGLIGTVMTLSQLLEIKLTGQHGSWTSSSKLLSLSPKNEHEMTSLSNKVHWGHGIALCSIWTYLTCRIYWVCCDHHIFCTVLTGDALLYAALGGPLPWHWKAERVDY